MEPNVSELLRTTAKNISELFKIVADRIEMLEKENEQLRKELQRDPE